MNGQAFDSLARMVVARGSCRAVLHQTRWIAVASGVAGNALAPLATSAIPMGQTVARS